MKGTMSLGQFRSEIMSYKSFQLLFDDPLTPLSFSVLFDQISVILSASPYIALKNSAGYLCLSHIQTIKKRGKDDGLQSYMFQCGDYSASNDPIPVTFVLKCA